MRKGNKMERREARDVPNPTLFCTMRQQAQAEKDGSWHVDSFKNTYIVHRCMETEQTTFWFEESNFVDVMHHPTSITVGSSDN